MARDRAPRTWIDVSAALTQRAGIARYVRGLTEAMVKLAPETLGTYSHSWTTPGVPPFGVPHAGSPHSARHWRMGLMAGHLLHRTVLPGLDQFDRFLATDLAFPFGSKDQMVVTVHDLTPVTHPGTHAPLTRFYSRFMLNQLKRRQHRIIAVSHQTARDLATHAGIDPRLITVIHPGVAEAFHAIPDASQVRETLNRYGLKLPFALTVGTLEPRKNLRRLIGAFERVAKPGETLVVVGGKGWGGEAGLGDQYRASDRTRVIGFVPDDDLSCLYRACQVFVMPSLHEGFGSPIAEALACNATVICSTQCGAIELAVSKVTLVDPLQEGVIAHALRQHLDQTEGRPLDTPHKVRTYSDAALQMLEALQQISKVHSER